MGMDDKLTTIADAIGRVPDCASIGLCSDSSALALVAELVRQKRTGISVVTGGLGMAEEMLAAAGCLMAKGQGQITVGGALETRRLRAAYDGVPYTLLTDDEAQHVDEVLRLASPDHAGGIAALPPLLPDVALIHAHAADRTGNVLLSFGHAGNDPFELLLARASAQVIVSVEQIVSKQTIDANPRDLLLRSDEVACVVEAPFGAYPNALPGRYDADEDAQSAWRHGDRETRSRWLADRVFDLPDHAAHLEQIGIRRLVEISTRRAV